MDSLNPADALEHLRDFLTALFEPGDIIEFRCLKKRRKTVQHWATLAELPGIHDELVRLNADGFSIYYGANPRKRSGGATADDVDTARAVYLDIDAGVSPSELVDRVANTGLREPTAVVFTGGGSQAVFRLAAPITSGEWSARQRALNAAVEGADSTICDPPRILRAPGFRNMKPERGPDFPMARVERFSRNIFRLEEFPEPTGYCEQAKADGPVIRNIDTAGTGILPRFATDFLEHGILPPAKGKEVPSRRETAFRVACEMAAAGIPQSDAAVRICARLYRLGLEESDVADFRERQLPNAFAKDRTPTIDPDRLPKAVAKPLPAEPELEVTALDNGKFRIVARRGVRSHVDTIDIAKASARQRFVKDAAKALGDGADCGPVDARLKAIAAGDAEPDKQAGPANDFIPVDDFIRPERFAVSVGDEHTSGTTVAKYRMGPKGIEGVWRTLLAKHDGTRECIDLPDSIEVGGKSFFVNPQIGPPGVTKQPGWSANGQDAWLTTGSCVMPPAELFSELRATYAEFLDFMDDIRDGALNTITLWTVLTYTPSVFPVVPFLTFNGPKGSGKTQVLNCLKNVCFRVLSVANPSAASLYRELHSSGGTVLIDEAESLESGDAEPGLMSALLHSNQRGSTVPRCEGENFTPTYFSVFGPKAFFAIREPHDPLADRSVSIGMLRSPPGSPKALLHPDDGHDDRWQLLRDALFAFVMNHGPQLARLESAGTLTPPGMFPRSRQVWGPLLALARLFESLGVQGLLATMQEFALDRSRRAEANTIDEVEEHVLRAFVDLRATKEEPPTSTEVQERAYRLGLDANLKLTAAATGKILRRYGIRHGTGRSRRQWFATTKHLSEVAARYGLALPEIISGKTPPETPSPLSPLSRDTGPGGGGDKGDKVSGGVPANFSGVAAGGVSGEVEI